MWANTALTRIQGAGTVGCVSTLLQVKMIRVVGKPSKTPFYTVFLIHTNKYSLLDCSDAMCWADVIFSVLLCSLAGACLFLRI